MIVVGSRWQAEYRMRCHLEPAVGGSDLAKMASGIAIKGSTTTSIDSRWEKNIQPGNQDGIKARELKLIRNPSELIPVAVIGWLAAPPG